MSKKKIVFQVLFLSLVMGMTLYNLFKDRGIYVFIQTLERAQINWLAVSLLLLLSYILLESLIIKIILVTLDEPVTVRQCMKYSFVGFFFYCISPAGSAEQPMQLLYMHRDGLSVSKAFVVLIIITITFKLSLVLLGGFVFALRPSGVMSMIEPVRGFCYAGIILSIGAVSIFIFALVAPGNLNAAMAKCIRALSKLEIIKNKDKWIKRKDSFIWKYAFSLEICKGHKLMPAIVFLVTIVQRLCYMGITAASCKALGVAEPGAFDVTLSQGMILLSTDMLPVPGGMGISEWLYMRTFYPSLGENTLSTLILSRGISFYCQLILCGLVTGAIWLFTRRKEGKSK